MPERQLEESTAPHALSELGSLITRIEDPSLRREMLGWAARHIRTVHVNTAAPMIPGEPRPAFEDWDRRMIQERVLDRLRLELANISTMSHDRSWYVERIGLVIIKD